MFGNVFLITHTILIYLKMWQNAQEIYLVVIERFLKHSNSHIQRLYILLSTEDSIDAMIVHVYNVYISKKYGT